MRIKATALVLSALLPLSALAMPEQGMQGQQGMHKQSTATQQKSSRWSPEKMQQRQSAWFDRLDLSAEQREAFKQEMSQQHAAQMKARAAHHDRLRALLTDQQRATFDADIAKREQRVQRYMQKNHRAKQPAGDRQQQLNKTQ